MANYTISGTGVTPDGAGPLLGTWHVGIYSDSGIAFDGDGFTWRAEHNAWLVDQDGSLEVSLPETTVDFLYIAKFDTLDQRHTYGPFIFELTANSTWQDVITTPALLPPPVTTQDILDRFDALPSITVAATAPASPAVDDVWIDTT